MKWKSNSPGDLNAEVVVHRDDELGAIARAFNSMIADIRARNEERERLLLQVSNFNQQLQAEVDDATRELRAANEALLETQQRLARSERLAAGWTDRGFPGPRNRHATERYL